MANPMAVATRPQVSILQPPGFQLPAESSSPLSLRFMLEDLARSGLTPEDVNAYPVEPESNGFTAPVPAYCLPYSAPATEGMHRVRYKRDDPKYLSPRDSGSQPYFPASVDPAEWAAADALYIVEGEKKAAAFHKYYGIPCLGIGGSSMYTSRRPYGPNDPHAWLGPNACPEFYCTLIPAIAEALEPGKIIYFVIDSDVKSNPGVQSAARRLALLAKYQHRARVVLKIPPSPFKGVDDYIMAGHAPLEGLEELPGNFFPVSKRDAIAYIPGLSWDSNPKTGAAYLQESSRNLRVLAKDAFEDVLFYDPSFGLCHGPNVYSGPSRFYQSASILFEALFPRNVCKFNKGDIVEVITDHIEDPKYQQNMLADKIKLRSEGVTDFTNLKTFGSRWFVKEQSDYADWVGLQLFCGLAARIMQPGCEMQTMVILTGPQGCGKTMFFKALGNFDFDLGMDINWTGITDLHSISHAATLKEEIRLLCRKKIVNLDEMSRMGSIAQSPLKRAVTNTKIKIDQKYERPFEQPIPFVYVGTTNHKDLLSDLTGQRRYLMLSCRSPIHRPTKEEIEDLIVEAAAYVEANQQWWVCPPEIDVERKKVIEEHTDIFSVDSRVKNMFEDTQWPVCTSGGVEYQIICAKHLEVILKSTFDNNELRWARSAFTTLTNMLEAQKLQVVIKNIDWNGTNPTSIGINTDTKYLRCLGIPTRR